MICPVCSESLTERQVAKGGTYCSKSCSIKARAAWRRGVSCRYEDCPDPVYAKGLCSRHHQRARYNGGALPPDRPDERTRFLSKVAVRDGDECWLWQGPINNQGYGRFVIYQGGREFRRLAHRYMLEMRGHDLVGRVVMHTCDTPRCVNPDHLRVGTQLDNMRDAITKGRLNTDGLALGRKAPRRRQTHCRDGHEYTAENTRITPAGKRVCRTCARRREQARRDRKQMRGDA